MTIHRKPSDDMPLIDAVVKETGVPKKTVLKVVRCMGRMVARRLVLQRSVAVVGLAKFGLQVTEKQMRRERCAVEKQRKIMVKVSVSRTLKNAVKKMMGE